MATWEVTGDQSGQFQWDAAGQPVQGHIISFRTGELNTGSVFVPDQYYTPEHVRTLIGPQAAIADEVRNLHS